MMTKGTTLPMSAIPRGWTVRRTAGWWVGINVEHQVKVNATELADLLITITEMTTHLRKEVAAHDAH